jgi:large subunit ribosomal protein L18
MDKQQEKQIRYQRRKIRARATISGTSDRPRLCLHRTVKHLEAQLIDDAAGKTVLGMKDMKKAKGTKSERAAAFGEAFGKAAIKAGVKIVVFDRNGRAFHGRVKAFADGARKAGLQF